MRRICPVLMAFGLVSACSVEASTPTKPAPAVAKAEKNTEPAKTPDGAMPAKQVEPTPEPEPEPAPAPEAAPSGGAPGPQAPGSELAQRFRDPPWYRKTLFPDATVTNTARSEANAEGLFQSHIVFELAKGSTKESCAEHLEKTVGESVPNLKREDQPDGRIKITGTTDRYEVTLLCGEAKGAIRAYVAFEWTS